MQRPVLGALCMPLLNDLPAVGLWATHPCALFACSATTAVLATARGQVGALGDPVPPLVQQLCLLQLPERLLRRLSKPDAPVHDLELLLHVLGQLSLHDNGQVRSAIAQQPALAGQLLQDSFQM